MNGYIRHHGPCGYRNYQEYKPWLRDDFWFRCVYCLEREVWASNRSHSLSADHFLPKASNPGLATSYPNLVYACTRCNSLKDEETSLLDPDRDALGEHIILGDDGAIVGLTPLGSRTIELLQLNEEPAISNRRRILCLLGAKKALADHEIINKFYIHWFKYPQDLEDLSALRPPGGNTRPAGIAESHYERRRRGEPPECY